jgi:pyruvate/2-oxoglutarate dehydrogenase complex dihydrolipoamide dehydrogenase (E3) component
VYNLVVIGAGSGGLVSAAGAAGVYAKVSATYCFYVI